MTNAISVSAERCSRVIVPSPVIERSRKKKKKKHLNIIESPGTGVGVGERCVD